MSQELEERLEQATFLLRELFPHYMSSMSEEIFCAGWLYDLDIELPRLDSLTNSIASFLREIPVDHIVRTWRFFPSAEEIWQKSCQSGFEQLELELVYAR